MSTLAKLTIKSVTRRIGLSPAEARRNKLLAGINEQMDVVDAAVRGERYAVSVPRWTRNEANERVRIERQRVVRAWFFERDGGVYVQCKYGSKALPLSKDGNAVFVKQLSEVKPVLEAFRAAVISGELDGAIGSALKSRPTP